MVWIDNEVANLMQYRARNDFKNSVASSTFVVRCFAYTAEWQGIIIHCRRDLVKNEIMACSYGAHHGNGSVVTSNNILVALKLYDITEAQTFFDLLDKEDLG